MEHNYIPSPIVDDKETQQLKELTEKYLKLTEPSQFAKFTKIVGEKVPAKAKEWINEIQGSINSNELFNKAMEKVAEGFGTIQKVGAKITISEKYVLSTLNKKITDASISSIDEVCLLRSYDIGKIVSKEIDANILMALAEGAGTGAMGFAGLPLNIAISTFLYFRAVEVIAYWYGYDVKTNPSELMIASEVFVSSLSPSQDNASEIGAMIGKIMLYAETTAIKQTAAKGWAAMAARGGITLVLTQMRALAYRSAEKALEAAGAKGLEETMFKTVFEQIGRRITLEGLSKKVVPVFGAIVGGCFDTAIMNQVVNFANVFYQKRFILEKSVRVNQLIGVSDDEPPIDADFSEIE